MASKKGILILTYLKTSKMSLYWPPFLIGSNLCGNGAFGMKGWIGVSLFEESLGLELEC